jgi:hypothetical protein
MDRETRGRTEPRPGDRRIGRRGQGAGRERVQRAGRQEVRKQEREIGGPEIGDRKY